METQDPSDIPQVGTIKRPKLDTIGVGKVSGRPWKQPSSRAGTLRNPGLSTTWEKKMKEKAETQAYRQRKREAQAAMKEKGKAARQQREEAKRKKEENRKKSEVVQRVSAATAKRMMKSKKQRKQLKTGDD